MSQKVHRTNKKNFPEKNIHKRTKTLYKKKQRNVQT